MSALQTVHGQPSWRLANGAVEAFVTETGGHLGPVLFRLGDRTVQPYHVAPWAEEHHADLPPMLRVLRGDFFCAPFGGGEPFEGEDHPPHGETANASWAFEALEHREDEAVLRLSLETTIRPGHVTRAITLVEGHTALYQRHTITGMTGPMSMGHHAMLRFPDREGSGLVATSPFQFGQTSPVPIEDPAHRGYSLLRPGARFDRLGAVPTVTGEPADLSRYPARRGYEDLVLLTSEEGSLAWTAVTFPAEGYVWFTLKDPRVLRHTVLWLSNGGRHYPPWSGRHANVLGLEEVTSYFHLGLAASAAPNPLSEQGLPTVHHLDGAPFEVACINAVAAVPDGFDGVAEIRPHAGEEAVTLTSRSGRAATVPLRHAFLSA
ncbi:MAG: hypothetical protein R3181_00720 [Rubricoccaceae bacterium]|nr:hypothetical protein [Rubricoccaceae bacterium]